MELSAAMALIILTACSGTGKSTLVKELLARHPRLKLSVSHTTRAPRPGEQDGVAYHFISKERFQALISEGAFAEWAEYAGNFYGTSHAEIKAAEERGDDLLFEVELIGAKALKAAYPRALSCFVLPPSWPVIEERLRGRQTEDEATIQRRLKAGRGELEGAGFFDYMVVNDELEEAVCDHGALYRSAQLNAYEQHATLKRVQQEARG